MAARLLREQGYRVRLGLLGDREALKGDAAAMARRWGGPVEPLTPATLAGADLIIDALFGAGLSRPLEGMAADVVAAINASGKPVSPSTCRAASTARRAPRDGPVVRPRARSPSSA